MRISSTKRASTQSSLFDVTEYVGLWNPDGTINHGRCRTIIGKFFEEVSLAYLGGFIHKTDCRCDYCPDLSYEEGGETKYVEIKGVGRSNQAFVYRGRLEKDVEFANSNSLSYLIWRHTVATTQCETERDLREALRVKTIARYEIPFADFHAIISRLKCDKLNSSYGKSDKEPVYGSGYRIPLGLVEEFRTQVSLGVE